MTLPVSVPVPIVTAVNPASGSSGGGTEVTISGTGFSAAAPTGAVRFGATTATYTVNSDTKITATAPIFGIGTVDVVVTTAGGSSNPSLSDRFTYAAAPSLFAVSPIWGPIVGGTSVMLAGSDLNGATSVTFGGTPGTGVTVIDANTVMVATPAHTAGAVDVAISTPGGIATLSSGFTYVAMPTLSGVSPNTGTTAGNTSVLLTGANLTGTTSVTFDGVPGTGVTVVNANSVAVTTPAHAAGAVDIAISTPGGIATLSNGFAYVASPPTITSFSPDNSGTSGGTSITLTGTNLTGATAVTFGGVPGIGLAVHNATTATVTTPAHAAGVVDLVVTTPSGSATFASSFTYQIPPPAISDVSPSSGTTAGGTSVTLTGSNLTGTTAVTFGGIAGTGVTVNSPTSVTVNTPAHAAGVVDIVISTPGGDTSVPNSFSYQVPLPTLTGISPGSGTTAGGTAVTLSGTNLSGATSITFDGTPGTGLVVSDARIATVITPPHAAGAVDVVIVTPDGNATSRGSFTYQAPLPTLSSASPNSGTAAGGTSLTLTGTNLTGATSVTFGGIAGTGLTVNSATSVTVTTPTHAASAVDVVISTPGGNATLTGGFTYVELDPIPPLVISVTDPANATYKIGDPMQFTIEFDQAVTVTGTPGLSIAIGSASRSALYLAGSGSSHLVFQYTVMSGDEDTDGISLAGLSLNGGTIQSTGGVDANRTLNNVSPTNGIFVDGVRPTVLSTQIEGTPGAGATTARFAVKFSEAVSGLSASDFTLTSTGTATAAIAGLTGSGANYSVPLSGISGSGSLRLDLFSPSGITDQAGNALAASYTSGSVWTVTPSPVVLSPATGTLLSAGTVGTAYSNTSISASGGTGAISYAASGLPAGLTISASTGAISGTPTTAGNASVIVTATDAASTSVSATYTLAISAAPTALSILPANGTTLSAGTVGAAYSNTSISASGGGGAIRFSASGLPAGLSISSSTGAITGTPTTAGSASVTVTATDAESASVSVTYTIAISAAPTPLSILPASRTTLSAGTVGAAYSNTSISASGGTGAIRFAASGLPAGLTISTSTGAITGTPTTAGNASVTVTATDAASASVSANYSLTVNPSATTFVFTPSGGALTEAMVGEDYSQPISAKGGHGVLIFSLASGTLPKGVTLNISTGALTGPLSTDAEAKDYSFTIGVRDAQGATGTASYTLKANPRAVTVIDQIVNVPAGSSPADVYLNRNATGGPFTIAATTFVEPANAGTVTIIQGQLAQAGPVTAPVGWYLHFTPDPAYSGQVRVGFKLTSALGISNTGTVTYNLSYDPAKVASDVDQLVHDFVRSRQNMIVSTITVPGLLERRQMEQATDPVTARMTPSEDGLTVNFSTSLAQLEAARNGAPGVSAGYSSPFNVWIDGAFLAHNDKDINGNKWGSFAMLSVGADYLLSDKALVGLSFHYDRMTDPTDADAELTGNGWMAGPYASFELGKGVFWNASLLYGGSSNDIDTTFWDGTFETTRFMADTSIEGEWSLNQDTVLTPKLRAVYFSETVDDYTVKNGAGDALTIDGFDEDQFRVSLGAEIARSFMLENGGKLTPKLGLTGGFSGLDGSGAFGTVKAGLSMQTTNLWMLDASLLFDIEGEGEKSIGAKVGASSKF